MTKLFGTDGIRGKAGEFPLDENMVAAIGSALVQELANRNGKTPRFIIGIDTRESGGWLRDAFCTGASSVGGEVDSAGVITTPGVAFLTAKLGYDAGVVISASHNPFYDNGLKVFLPSGKKLDDEIESAVENRVGSRRGHVTGSPRSHDRSLECRDLYVEHLLKKIDPEVRIDGKIVIDCANGAASSFTGEVFQSVADEVVIINNEPDGRNINLDCGSLHLEQLAAKVISEKASFGIAFDGDADRALFVDENGETIDGDATLWIIAQYLKRNGGLANGNVVATVMSNVGLEIALKSIGAELIRTDVGDKYVLESLLATGSEIGGEQSGHIIFPASGLVGDGMATAILLINAVGRSGGKFTDAATGFTRLPQVLVNVRVSSKPSFESIDAIKAVADSTNAALYGKGRLLLRYSGTENLARVMIEGQDQDEIETMANNIARVIKDSIG